jgi:hypothetical protein
MSLQEIQSDLSKIKMAKAYILDLYVLETNEKLLRRGVIKIIEELNKLINEFEIEEQYIKEQYIKEEYERTTNDR